MALTAFTRLGLTATPMSAFGSSSPSVLTAAYQPPFHRYTDPNATQRYTDPNLMQRYTDPNQSQRYEAP